jgi:hypothetical protein
VVEMAAVGQPMQQHLVGELEKEVQDISAAAVRKELLSHEFALVDVRCVRDHHTTPFGVVPPPPQTTHTIHQR